MNIRFDKRVAIVTGAGQGLGRSHALALADRGARVVVADLGVESGTESSQGAQDVAAQIQQQGGEAIACGVNVADYGQVECMVEQVMAEWGRIDILINNAGILRDKSFAKAPLEDFKLVLDVHLMGSVHCTRAVWGIMKEQNYGRIVMTASASGIYGNFGQSNYAAAKMGLIGLMNALVLEGERSNIHVNSLCPTAATQMTEGLIDNGAILELMQPRAISTGMLALCAEDSPNKMILSCGAGGYATVHVSESEGIYLAPEEQSPENIFANLDQIRHSQGDLELANSWEHTNRFVNMAAKAQGIEL